MADKMKNNKTKKLFIDLSLFTCTTETTPTTKSSIKSPRHFEDPNGVVGLGILAALNDDDYCSQDPFFKRSAILAVSPRLSSNPIPILKKLTSLSSSAAAANNSSTSTNDMNKRRLSIEEMELCEEYTCVISHVGSNQVKKKEYFDNTNVVVVSKAENASANSNSNIGHWVSSGLVSTASSAVNHSHGGEIAAAAEAFPFAEFLNSCYLCKKQLHGLDIFMYRGEKAFCSTECRYKHISLDEHKEKYVSGTMKSLEYSASPCSSPMQFLAGVAAA